MQIPAVLTHNVRHIFTRRRGRHLREYITGYLMVAPALFLIFLFGIFPVGFALYVSLYKWVIVRGNFRGLQNYVSAIANFTYIVMFVLGVGALVLTVRLARGILPEIRRHGGQAWLLALPGLVQAVAVVAFFRWVFFFLPEFLDIANKMRGLERTRELFVRLLSEAFHAETAHPAWQQFFLLAVAAFVLSLIAFGLWRFAQNASLQLRFMSIWLALGAGVGLLFTTYRAITDAYAAAVDTGVDPGVWPQMIAVLSGVVLLALAWRLWRSATDQPTTRSFALRLLGATGLMVGAVLLIVEIPTIVASGDKDMWEGLKVTVFFSLGTVPVQLTIALFLAVLLFQKLRGSDLFRIIFFLPYVTPVVASATIFRLLFSERQAAPINSMLGWIGIPSQLWLRQPKGILTLLANAVGISDFPQVIIPHWFPPDPEHHVGELVAGAEPGPYGDHHAVGMDVCGV